MSNDTYTQTLADAAAIVLAYLSDDKEGADAALKSALTNPAETRQLAHAAVFLAEQMARKEVTARAELGSGEVPPSLSYVVAVARSAAKHG